VFVICFFFLWGGGGGGAGREKLNALIGAVC
jgi:hypothetical protein